MALCVASCEGVWLARLLAELGHELNEPIPYYEDNQSTIKVVEESRDRSRLKHIDVKLSFIRELVQKRKIILKYMQTDKQQADILTKGLPA